MKTLYELMLRKPNFNSMQLHGIKEQAGINRFILCAAPYLGAAYIQAKEGRNEEDMAAFIRQRRNRIKAFILRGVKK